jgi:PAS domain S-box-containing protein
MSTKRSDKHEPNNGNAGPRPTSSPDLGTEHFQQFLSGLPVMVHLTDRQGVILGVSDFWLQKMGYAKAEVIGCAAAAFLTEDSRRTAGESARPGQIESGTIENIPCQMVKKDGSPLDVLMSVNTIRDPHGSLLNELAVLVDVTRQKQAERALKEREGFLDTLLDAIPTPVFYKDRDGRYAGFNKAFESFFGQTREELIGKSVFDINPRQLAEIYHAKDRELFEREGEQRYESQVKNAGGELRDVIFNKSVYRDKSGAPDGLIGVVLDITERKTMEDRLKTNEQRYESAQRMGRVGNWEYDLSTENFWGSDEAKRIYGLDPAADTFTTDDIESCIPERERVHQALMDLIEKGTPYDLEFEIRPVSGPNRKSIKSIAELVRNDAGIPKKVVGVIQDITTRKKAEEKLRKSEEKFRILFESSKDAIYMSTLQGNIVNANRSFFELFGIEEERLGTIKAQELYVDPNDRGAFVSEIQKNGFVKNFDVTLLNAGGQKMNCQITATVRRSMDGAVDGYQGIIRDITKSRKKQQERDKLIEDLQQALQEVKTLSGLLPICSHCKKIKDDQGYWKQIEAYIQDHSEAQFSHGICRECADKYYPDMDLYEDDET